MKKEKKKNNSEKIIATNRNALRDFYLEEKLEAGIMLEGSEVKSLRDGKMSLSESYVVFNKGEPFLLNAHIPTYLPAGQFNHDPIRARKLLLHKKQLERFQGLLSRKGYTLIPVHCYFKKGRAKLEIALARGRKKGDKREKLKEKAAIREMRKFR